MIPKISSALPRVLRTTVLASAAAITMMSLPVKAEQINSNAAEIVSDNHDLNSPKAVLLGIEKELSKIYPSKDGIKNAVYRLSAENIKDVANLCKSKLCTYDDSNKFNKMSSGEILLLFIADNSNVKLVNMQDDTEKHMIDCLRLAAIKNGSMKKEEVLNSIAECTNITANNSKGVTKQFSNAYGIAFNYVFSEEY